MEEQEMSNASELLVKEAKENQTRLILEIMSECKDLDEAKERIKDLIK